MSLRETLERWDGLAPSLLKVKDLGAPALVRTSQELARRSSGLAEPPTMESIEELADRFRTAIADRALDEIPDRDWARVAFALWHGETPLAAHETFLGSYLARLDQRRRRRDVALLASAYLRAYSPSAPAIRRVAQVLARLVQLWEWPWAARHRELRLFDPERGPGALAVACLDDDEPARVLAKLGLEHLHGQGLVLAAQQLAVEKVEKALAAGRDPDVRLERLLRWVVDASGVAPRLRGPLADALLRPWLSRPVPDQLKERIQEFLLQHYGDPRIRPQRWMAVSEEARQVFRKWLARVALAQFLDVIDRLAFDRQWKYRRAFWTGYFDRDWVSDAQVAFGPGGATLAVQLFGRDAPFATLVKGGRKQIDQNHAVLLFRLGDLVIADWSHNGRCAIWREGNRKAPSLRNGRYTSDDVDWLSADQSWVHAGAANYAWQNKVRDFIADETGLLLHQRDYRIG